MSFKLEEYGKIHGILDNSNQGKHARYTWHTLNHLSKHRIRSLSPQLSYPANTKPVFLFDIINYKIWIAGLNSCSPSATSLIGSVHTGFWGTGLLILAIFQLKKNMSSHCDSKFTLSRLMKNISMSLVLLYVQNDSCRQNNHVNIAAYIYCCFI